MPVLLPLLAAALPGGLHVDMFTNAALAGTPSARSTVGSLDFELEMGGSAEVSGTLTLPSTRSYFAFECRFAGGQLFFVWIDDHLVCHTSQFGHSPYATDGTPQNPLRALGGRTRLPVVVHVYSSANGSATGDVTSSRSAQLNVTWARLAAPAEAGASPSFAPIPPASLSPASPSLELRRRALQKSLKRGWNPWSRSMLDVIRLPHSLVLTTAICQISSADCLNFTCISSDAAVVRVGAIAADQSYWQFYVGYRGLNVSLSFTGGEGALHVLAEPIGCAGGGAAGTNCSDYALAALGRYAWYRPGRASASADGAFAFATPGLPPTVVQPTADADEALTQRLLPRLRPSAGPGAAAAAFGLGDGPVGLREGGGARPEVAEVRAAVGAARAAEYARYAGWGELAELKEALQAATLWNYAYTPAEYGLNAVILVDLVTHGEFFSNSEMSLISVVDLNCTGPQCGLVGFFLGTTFPCRMVTDSMSVSN